MSSEIAPLGGKTSLGTSVVVAEFLAVFNIYKAKVLALAPINTPEKAHEYRKLIAEFMPETKKCMGEIKLDF